MERFQATTVLVSIREFRLGKLKGAEYGVDALNLSLVLSIKNTLCSSSTSMKSCDLSNVVDIGATSAPRSHQLKILCWNVNGDLKAKMLCPDFLNTITQYDMCLLQETHLYPLEHKSLNIPESFKVISLPRKYKKAFKKQFGGVIAFYNKNISVSLNTSASSTDIMVLDLEDLTIINVYILPEYQTWDKFTDVDPFQSLQESLTSLQERNCPVIAMGDFNARTGLIGSPNYPRKSEDVSISTRGRALTLFCATSNFILLNGTALFGEKTQNYTSFQPRGNAVVDYLTVNETGLDAVSKFEVLPPQLEWSDHAPLSVGLKFSTYLPQQPRPPGHKKNNLKIVPYNEKNPLDVLQKQITQAVLTPEAKLAPLWSSTCLIKNIGGVH